MKSVLILSIFFTCIFAQCNLQNYKNSVCSKCLNTTEDGVRCGWCEDYFGNSFCAKGQDANTANCTSKNPEEPNFYATKISQCNSEGGCIAQESCSDCSKIIGCGWCFKGREIGCIESDTNSTQCSALVVGNCKVPCNVISDCHYCTANNCSWCPSSLNTTDASSGNCSDINSQCNTKNITIDGLCPTPMTSTSATSTSTATTSTTGTGSSTANSASFLVYTRIVGGFSVIFVAFVNIY